MKEWIALGLDLEGALAEERDEDARPATLESFAARSKQGARTLSRSVAAVAWLRPELKRWGVALEDFKLSLVATETLRRVAVLDRRRLDAMMPAVLLGKLTYSDIVEERDRLVTLQNYKEFQSVEDIENAIERIWSFVTSSENVTASQGISDPDTPGQAIALPDGSFQADRARIAVFYPPEWGTSRTIAVALVRVFASLCFYDRSYCFFDRSHHGDVFEQARNEVPAEISAKLITVPLAALSESAVLRAALPKRLRKKRQGS